MQKIILGSVLKPVDDTRVYEKFGLSLAKRKNTEIIIFGTNTNDVAFEDIQENIRFESYDSSKKSSRILVSRLFLSLLKKEKPNYIIVHTIELLPIILWYKITHPKVKLCYDMLENYPLNFTAQQYHSTWYKTILSQVASWTEKLSYPFLDKIFVAEKAYTFEKKIPLKKTVILENKYAPILSDRYFKKNNEDLTITLCGSLTAIFGVYGFLKFVENASSCNNRLKFKIIGKAHEQDVIDRINLFGKTHNIELIGIHQFVPHKKIIKEMLNSDFIALPYPDNDSTKNCIPTKMYECLALGIPMLIQHNKIWKEITTPLKAALYIDFNTEKNFDDLYLKMTQLKAYPKGPHVEAYWINEERKLLNSLKFD